MHSQYILSLLAAALLSDAFVLPSVKRDADQPCPLRDSTTSFLFGGGDDEWTDKCPVPATFSKDSDGNCGEVDAKHSCAAYCEESTAWFYGREIKYNLSPCHSDSKCVLTETDTVTVTNAYTVNFGIKGIKGAAEALNMGFSYQYSVADAKSKALAQTSSDGFCGYWTFLPFYWATWGTLSQQEFKKTWIAGYMGSGSYSETCSGDTITEQVYNYKPVVDSNGAALGETVFVKTNCETGKKLCGKYQKPAYTRQAEPDINDPKLGWHYTDDDCEDSAGSDGAPVTDNPNKPTPGPSTPTSSPATPTGVGNACTDNSQCGSNMICNAGLCQENTWKPSAAA